jgi:hypothetical protein
MERALIVVVIFTAFLSAKNASRNREYCCAWSPYPAALPRQVPSAKRCLERQRRLRCRMSGSARSYVLRSEGLYYRIRSRDRKHPVLLPIGEQAQFHLQRDRLLLQVEDFDSKAYEFSVLAIVPENHGGRFRQRPVENKDSSESLQETLQ